MASVTATNILCRAPVAGKRAARAAPAAARVAAPTRMTSSVSLEGSKGAFEGVAMRAERRGAALRAITRHQGDRHRRRRGEARARAGI